MYALLKHILFLLPAELAHHVTMHIMHYSLKIPFVSNIFRNQYVNDDKRLHKTLWGIDFPNPVGLAAGFDKDGKYYQNMSHLGFGFIEIGTVTPKAQDGNPKPRLFRLTKDRGLINRMGFNNDGVDAMVSRIKSRSKGSLIIGGNIGKNKVTPNENATIDYLYCFHQLFDHVDYFVVNVSSPNTPGLRELQEKAPLTELLSAVQAANHAKSSPKPILLKIAPDLTITQLDDIIEIIHTTKLDGVIATNTTIDRNGLVTDTQNIGNGGLSGSPLFEKSLEVVRYIHNKSNATIPIIGVGGIDSPSKAKAMLDAGASLIQVYSGMVYYGPSLVKDINQHLLNTYI